jgi:hypothetical protein
LRQKLKKEETQVILEKTLTACSAWLLFYLALNYTHSSEKELPQIWHAIIYISIIEAKNSRKFKTKIGNKE